MDATDKLMPGPEGKTPRSYEVDKGHKTESYLTAIQGNPIPPGPSSSGIRYEPASERVALAGVPPKQKGQIGISEAELLPYRDDAFWVALRWILFILFWVLWIGMLIVAVCLVALSPGCALRHSLSWWQQSLVYNVWVPSFQDSDGDGLGDLQGLIQRLDNLRKSGVQTVWPSPFLLSDGFSNAVRDHHALDAKLGVNQLADGFLKEAHSRDLHVVLSLPLATTSTQHDWFLRSQAASKPENKDYSKFYYWLSRPPGSTPPQMVSVHKNLSYIHEPGNPKAALLNWKEDAVRHHMFEVLSSWIKRGVDGFHLTAVEYLARSADFSKPDWPAIQLILKDVRKHVDTFATESGIETKIALFATAEGASERLKQELAATGLDTVINYELTNVEKNTKVCHINEQTVAICAHEILSDVLLFHSLNPGVWPHWELSNGVVSRLSARAGSRAHAELLVLVQLLLPGTQSFYYGEEIGMRDLPNGTQVPIQRGAMQWDDTTNSGFTSKALPDVPSNPDFPNVNWAKQWAADKSFLKMFARMAKLRQRDETLSQGETIIGPLESHQAFLVVRFPRENVTSGNVFVCAVNFGVSTITLSLDTLPHQAGLPQAQIVASTSNAANWNPRSPLNLPAGRGLDLPADTGIVFKYPMPALTTATTDH
ncbi:unnamed protein product, partial [Mesorhabditis spiculigera]